MAGNMDDDDDFGYFGGGKSRLSNLFPSQAHNEEDVNQSLIFVPPKQPKKTEEQSSFSLRNYSLLHVISAYTYKLDQGQYSNQGKLGAAILGDVENSAYKLLLYTGKKQQVALSTITADFKFSIEPNWYAKFSDDKGDSWSVKFGSEEMLIEFAKQVALARANTLGKTVSKLILQDLVAGEGAPVEQGDSVGISYVAWFFKNHGFGEIFEDNRRSEKPLIVKLSKGNVIKGLCDGVLGAKKHMKRLLIIPASLAYGADGHSNIVPPNQPLIYEIVIKKIKSCREMSSSPGRDRAESEIKPDVPPRTKSVSDDSIRSRGASISEQLTQSPRKDNAKLISRMAKMGMPTLPLQGATTAHTSSESEAEIPKESDIERRSASPKPAPVATLQNDVPIQEVYNVQRRSVSSPRTSSPLVQTPGLVPQPSNAPVYSSYTNPAIHGDPMGFMSQPVIAHPAASFMSPLVPGLLESHLPLLITETRTQSTEIRMLLGKISDKLDTIAPKVDEIKSLQVVPSEKGTPYMEASVLSQNIQRIIHENAVLKKENEVKSSKIQELNEKICDILQRNQRFFEESNSILEQRSDSLQMTTSQLQNKVLALEQEKMKLSSSLAENVSKLHQMQVECNEKDKVNNELTLKVETSENSIKELRQMVENLKTLNSAKEGLQQEKSGDLEEWIKKANDLKLCLEEAQEELKDVKSRENTLLSKLSEMTRAHCLEAEEQKCLLQAEVDKVNNLTAELEEANKRMREYKKKHESFVENTRALKSRYDAQMESLTAELKQQKMIAKYKEPSQDFSAEVKKAMNMLYKVLQSEMSESQTYSSSEVLELTLKVIRRVTLRFIDMALQQKQQQELDSSSHKTSSPHSSKEDSIDHSSQKNEATINCDQINYISVSSEIKESTSELQNKDVPDVDEPSSQTNENAIDKKVQSQEQETIPPSSEEVKEKKCETILEQQDDLKTNETTDIQSHSNKELIEADENDIEDPTSMDGKKSPDVDCKKSFLNPPEDPTSMDGKKSPDCIINEMFDFTKHASTQWRLVLVVVLLLACLLFCIGALVDDMEATTAHSTPL